VSASMAATFPLSLHSVGLGLVQPVGCGVPFGPARHENRTEGLCLGRCPRTKHDLGTARRPVVPYLARPSRVVPGLGPCRAWLGGPNSHLCWGHV
jgi:hypothetical protein